jgi:hypothetical protein
VKAVWLPPPWQARAILVFGMRVPWKELGQSSATRAFPPMRPVGHGRDATPNRLHRPTPFCRCDGAARRVDASACGLDLAPRRHSP